MKNVFWGMAVGAAMLAGCASDPTHDFLKRDNKAEALVARFGPNADLGHLMYAAGQRLVVQSSEPLDAARPILVSTLVSIDRLNVSSPFGRMAAQLVASRLTQLGFTVQDVTYARALTVGDTGQTVLSRNIKDIGSTANAQAVAAGTYAVIGAQMYVNIRLLRADNGIQLSSVDVVLPADEYNSSLNQP